MDDYASQTSHTSISKKHKQNEVVLLDGTQGETNGGTTGFSTIDKKVEMGDKGKTKIDCNETWQDQIQVVDGVGNHISEGGPENSVDIFKSIVSGSSEIINVNGFSSDFSYHDDDAEDEDDDDDVSDYGDNDDFSYDDYDYLKLQAQFDNVDLPPGVEASVPWLKDPTPSEKTPENTMATSTPSLQVQVAADLEENEKKTAATSSSTVHAESGDGIDDEVIRKYLFFKQFDTVEDFSDHHFNRMGFVGEQPPKNWAKKIQEEWKILEKDLPDTIFVRVYEARMDLLRAVIVGPAGTPYHDGLFVFDILFPPNYPSVPPMVYYYSGGLRLNPNLYDCGKVCLSLLNTWNGKKTEMWIPGKSTMLQVLVSIQALILNTKPFFNEPGYENMYVGEDGERRSKQYNEDVFILSLKTMVYTIRRPPKHFEDFVVGHFRQRASDILVACKAYREGIPVGSVIKEGNQNVNEVERTSPQFKEAVAKMINTLVTNFTKNGSKDCEQFRVSAESQSNHGAE